MFFLVLFVKLNQGYAPVLITLMCPDRIDYLPLFPVKVVAKV